MKRTKALAMTLAAAIMMMGAGYAYWTDTLTINNTVSTGELKVEFTQANLVSVEKDSKYIKIESDGDIGLDGKSVSFEAENLYPGASLDFDAVFENVGTIPAVINNLDLVPSGDADRTRFLVTGSINVGGDTLPVNTTLDQLENIVTSKAQGIRLEPQATVILDLNIQLDPTLTGDQQEKVSLSEVFTINFRQHNAPQQ